MLRKTSRRSILLHFGKIGRRTNVIKKSRIGMSRYLDTSAQSTNDINHGPIWKIQSFLLNEICTVILWQDYYGKWTSRKFYWSTDGKKVRIGNVYSLTEKKDYSCLCMWTIYNWLTRKRTSIRLGKYSWTLIWENQHHSLTTFLWVALQRECQISKDIVGNYKSMFEWRISAVGSEKLPEPKASGKPEKHTISSWSYDLDGHAKKCVGRYCELANKTIEQLFTVSTPRSDDHQFKEEQIGSVGRIIYCLLTNCSENVYIWHELGDLLFYGPWTNLPVRSRNGQKLVTNVQRVWLHTFITHVNSGNIVMWETQQNDAD